MRIGSITLPARRGRLMRSDAVQRLLAFAALIVIIIIFSLLTPNFLQFDYAIGILLATTVNGILALGVTFVIISGGIDLSIGTVMTLAAVITAVTITELHLPVPVGIAAGIATGALAGLVNGTFVAKLKIPSFIATLGVLIGARLNSAQPSLGQGYELDAIAAAVIGGTSLSGGEGSILGTVIGAFIISTLTNGLRILSVPQEWQTVVTGSIVIVAVYLDIVRRRQQQ